MSTLRAQMPTPPDQSRPRPRGSKSFRLLTWRRLAPRHHHNPTSSSAHSTMSAAFSHASKGSGRAFRRRQAAAVAQPSSDTNAMDWLQHECPPDLLPQVLSFAGPQTMAAMSKTNRFWRGVTQKESTWKILCQELYKWKQGDKVPISWKAFYRFNPCVPVDYSSVSEAINVVRNGNMGQARSIRVLLRPGRYVMREAITIQAPPHVVVELETMEMPASYLPVDQTSSTTVPEDAPTRKRKGLRHLLSCRSDEAVEQQDDFHMNELFEQAPFTRSDSSSLSDESDNRENQRATLVLRTRRSNEPLFRVQQGRLNLRQLELCHSCHGTDIWNGNAAVQIQPPFGPDDMPLMVVPTPTVVMDNVEIVSASGRGIVNIDGGHLTVRNCYVHDCAATGIYVGGPGSEAKIEHTDVIRNGNGNSTHRRGIGRGHSGIYLEQGLINISNSSISRNSLTGISAVSPDNAILNLSDSELVSNGSFQLEMPAIGSSSHRRSNTENNTMTPTGAPRYRSGLVVED